MGLCEATLEGHQGEVLCMKMADSRNPRIVSGGGSTCKTIKGMKGLKGLPASTSAKIAHARLSLSLSRGVVWKDWYSNLSSVTAKRDRISLSLSGQGGQKTCSRTGELMGGEGRLSIETTERSGAS